MSAANADVLISTTPSFEGKRIVKYLGMVTGEASTEVDVVTFTPGTKSFSDAYHKVLPGTRDSALQGVIRAAREAGANAVVGARIDYVIHGSGKGLVLVAVTGTAVVVEDL
jgi:uncharacterized protein YbjQ (UPF0145 family)